MDNNSSSATNVNRDSIWVVYCTCPNESVARTLAQALLEARLAACVSILPGLCSLYHWQNELNEDREILLMIKTCADSYTALEELILQQHPYQLPEILALPVRAGHPGYLQWVRACCMPVGSEE